MLPNCSAILTQFATAQAVSGRQWNNQIVGKKSLTTMVTLYFVDMERGGKGFKISEKFADII